MAYLKDFQSRIQQNDYPGFLKIWEEYCYGDQPDGQEIIATLEAVKNSSLAKSFGLHVERGLALWRLLQNAEEAHQVLRLILDLQTTQSEELADLATEFLKNRHPEDPLLQEKLRLVGLRTRERFQGAISHFELLTHMQPGNFVFHTAGWGTGEVLEVSFLREEVTLEFEYVVGAQHFSFEKAFKTLVPLPSHHFCARRFGNPDALEKEARENPNEILRLLLKDLGPKNGAEIKRELYDLVIPAADWNRWWQTARLRAKKDTKIESPKDLKEPFRLLEKEVPHEVSFHKQLEANPSVESSIQMIYSFLRDFPETLKNQEFRTSLQTRLSQWMEGGETLSTAQRIELLFLMEDLGLSKANQKVYSLLFEEENKAGLICSLSILPFQKRALQIFMKSSSEWPELFLDLLFLVDQNLLRDFLLQELNTPATQEALKQKLSALLIHPISFPDVFLWYFQKILDKKAKLPFSEKEGQNRFFEGLLILLDHLEKKPHLRDLSKKIINLITEDRYKLVRDMMKQSSTQEVKEYLLLSTKCGSLTDHDIKIFYSLAEVAHPSLVRSRKEKGAGSEEEEVLWTTQEGYQKVVQRMQQIATVETVDNAKEIETARALGDLRENAEFKAALERRDRLQGELKLLSDQIAKARVFSREDVPTEEVGIGSVVHCQDSKGEKHRFVLLGPWDADPENRILSFQSKLAQAMRGHVVGEKFSFQGDTFTITDIQNYFDQNSLASGGS